MRPRTALSGLSLVALTLTLAIRAQPSGNGEPHTQGGSDGYSGASTNSRRIASSARCGSGPVCRPATVASSPSPR